MIYMKFYESEKQQTTTLLTFHTPIPNIKNVHYSLLQQISHSLFSSLHSIFPEVFSDCVCKTG